MHVTNLCKMQRTTRASQSKEKDTSDSEADSSICEGCNKEFRDPQYGEVMVAALRANSSVLHAVVECVVDHCNQTAETAVHSFQNATLNSLQAAGLENDVIEKSNSQCIHRNLC